MKASTSTSSSPREGRRNTPHSASPSVSRSTSGSPSVRHPPSNEHPLSVLITGSSRGSIGGALAAAFARQNLTVFATAREPSKIDPAIASLPNVHPLKLDVTNPQSVSQAVEQVLVKTKGKLNFLINNAGSGYTIPLAEVEIDIGKKIFDVNLWGVLNVTKAFVPFLVETGGTVVNISSVGALVNTPWIGKI